MPTARTQNFGMGLKKYNSFKGNSANRGKATSENQNRQKRLDGNEHPRHQEGVSCASEEEIHRCQKKELPTWILMQDFTPKSSLRAFHRGNYRHNNKWSVWQGENPRGLHGASSWHTFQPLCFLQETQIWTGVEEPLMRAQGEGGTLPFLPWPSYPVPLFEELDICWILLHPNWELMSNEGWLVHF